MRKRKPLPPRDGFKYLDRVAPLLGLLRGPPRVFDPALLRHALRELAADALPAEPPADARALADLVAVDGTPSGALSALAHATARGGKLHLASRSSAARSVPPSPPRAPRGGPNSGTDCSSPARST